MPHDSNLGEIIPSTGCRLCGKPKQEWQVYCGAACCVAWETGIRTLEQLDHCRSDGHNNGDIMGEDQ